MASHRFQKGNKFGVGANSSAPAKYDHPNQLQKKVEEYFEFIAGEEVEDVDEQGRKYMKIIRDPMPATITGLALFLGFNSRQSLLNYAEKPEFVDIIIKAKTMVEMAYEENLHGSKPTGSIFALSNMGWRNEKFVDHTTKGEKIAPSNNIITGLSEETLRELASKLPSDQQTDSGNKP